MADFTKNLVESLKKYNLNVAEQYLEIGASPNSLVESATITPMHLAAGLGLEPVCLLLQHGGDPNVCIHDRTTPLHVAAMWGNSDSVQILLANGGDPFLKDLDGMSALDLACQYGHGEVEEVLRHYMALLSKEEDQTITPKFTYTRRSINSNASYHGSSPSEPEEEMSPDISLNDVQVIDNHLQQFAKRRHSSMYLRSIQSQVNKFFGEGQKTHLVDVTSPDHPYVEPRLEPEPEPDDKSYDQSENSLNLQLSLSEDEQSTSYESFVTCDGEDLDTVLKNSESGSFFQQSPECPKTVIKNPRFISYSSPSKSANNNCSSESCQTEHLYQERQSKGKRSRGDKYCKRGSMFTLSASDRTRAEQKCDYCGCYTASNSEEEETVCETCEKLGIELDQMIENTTKRGKNRDSVQNEYLLPKKDSKTKMLSYSSHLTRQDSQPTGNQTKHVNTEKRNSASKKTFSREEDLRETFKELSRQFKRTSLDPKVTDFANYKKENEIAREYVKPECNFSNKSSSTERTDVVNCGFYKPDLNDLLISTDTSFVTRPIKKAEFHPSDISTITMDDCSCDSQDNLDQGYSESQLVKTIPCVTIADNLEKKTNQNFGESMKNAEFTRENVSAKGADKTKYGRNKGKESASRTDIEKFDPSDNQSPNINDLWSEVRAKSMQSKKFKRENILDTAFYGRDSLGSIISNASTVEYVYTDKENGIVLVERHIPSQCGSTGSRRSLDSLFSLNTNERSVVDCSPNSAEHELNSSQDTILYDWRENAMIQEPEDTGTDNKYPVSQALLKLDDDAVRSKLVDLGDDPGPVTKTTRQVYLRRLSQLQNDPNAKPLSKTPGFPPELSAVLRGTLDLSNMPQLEQKMVSAFQKPDRQRLWREGTLKSSFNYILLDPRISKDLPNRSANMTDLEVFQTFISATFYIGKGKRARPYAHLYEAIREMKKQTGKASQKVQKIMEIWACDLGVVSLHCFQSVIPVEAYTREACMVDGIGLAHLTNKKRGDYYGVSTTYSMKERRTMGVFLLSKALQIFLVEGERQIAPLDIKNDP